MNTPNEKGLCSLCGVQHPEVELNSRGWCAECETAWTKANARQAAKPIPFPGTLEHVMTPGYGAPYPEPVWCQCSTCRSFGPRGRSGPGPLHPSAGVPAALEHRAEPVWCTCRTCSTFGTGRAQHRERPFEGLAYTMEPTHPSAGVPAALEPRSVAVFTSEGLRRTRTPRIDLAALREAEAAATEVLESGLIGRKPCNPEDRYEFRRDIAAIRAMRFALRALGG